MNEHDRMEGMTKAEEGAAYLATAPDAGVTPDQQAGEKPKTGQTGASPVAIKRGDRVFTPDWAAADMVRFFSPSGRVLEPCCGDGAILKHLPPGSEWCEIEKGRNFFDWREAVDWVISNPPYSKLRPFLKHAFVVANNVAFLVPARNVFSGYGTVREAKHFGRMKNIRWYGTGGSLGFPMGNAVAAIHWQRDWPGPATETFVEDERDPVAETMPELLL